MKPNDTPGVPVGPVPQGWRLVPVTPTPQMRDAAVQAICYGPEGGFTRIAGPDKAWKAMLDAAPEPDGVSRPDGKTFCGDTPMTPEKT